MLLPRIFFSPLCCVGKSLALRQKERETPTPLKKLAVQTPGEPSQYMTRLDGGTMRSSPFFGSMTRVVRFCRLMCSPRNASKGLRADPVALLIPPEGMVAIGKVSSKSFRRFLASMSRQCPKKSTEGAAFLYWCEEGDSNSHGRNRWNLNPVRLPIPPSSRLRYLILSGLPGQRRSHRWPSLHNEYAASWR